MRGDGETAGRRCHEQLQAVPSLVDMQEHPLAVRPEREDSIQTGVDEIVHNGREGSVVECCAAVAERRHGSGNGSAQHVPTLCSPS
jgi:hypothetical protein